MKYLLSILCVLAMQHLVAQEIEVDKSNGLIKVNGQDAFYLVKKSKGINSDLSLQNLKNEELAYLHCGVASDLTPEEGGNKPGTYYLFTFSETANTAIVFPESFSVLKNIAKQVINANLVKDGTIDPKAERAFVASHHGKMFKDPEKIQITVNTAAPSASKAAEISIKGSGIYNNDELIGSFKKVVKDGINTVSIYNKSDSKIATAIRPDHDDSADWNITTTADNKSYQVLYNTSTPLEKLFKFLAEKGLF